MPRAMLKTAFSSIGSFAMVRSHQTAAEALHQSVRSRRALPLMNFQEMSAASAGGGIACGVGELKPQKTLRVSPVIFGRGQRDAEGVGDLGHRQPGEEAQFHDRRGAGIVFFELLESLVERQQVELRSPDRGFDFRQVHAPPSSTRFLGGFVSRLFNQNSAHGLGSRAKEMSPAIPET